MNELCFGQRYDSELGILEPWYVNAAVDRIKQMDLKDKSVMEWGGGASTVWWSMKAGVVYSVDHNLEWHEKTNSDIRNRKGCCSVVMCHVDSFEGDQSEKKDSYIKPLFLKKVDIAIVDGIHRYECAEYAVKVLKPEILIIDNHQQDYVFICPKLDELLEGVRMERFIQPDHTNHEGRPWATAIFYLNDKNNN